MREIHLNDAEFKALLREVVRDAPKEHPNSEELLAFVRGGIPDPDVALHVAVCHECGTLMRLLSDGNSPGKVISFVLGKLERLGRSDGLPAALAAASEREGQQLEESHVDGDVAVHVVLIGDEVQVYVARGGEPVVGADVTLTRFSLLGGAEWSSRAGKTGDDGATILGSLADLVPPGPLERYRVSVMFS